MKIYREVKCSERLPEKDGYYYVINEGREEAMFYYKGTPKFVMDGLYGEETYTPEIWLELIENELDSEKILPNEERSLFKECFSAEDIQSYAEKLEEAKECTMLCLEEQIKLLNWVISMSSPTVNLVYNSAQQFIIKAEKLQQQLKLLKNE